MAFSAPKLFVQKYRTRSRSFTVMRGKKCQHPNKNYIHTFLQLFRSMRKEEKHFSVDIFSTGILHKKYDTGVLSRILHLFFQIHFPVGLKHLFWVFDWTVKSLTISIQDLYSCIKWNTVLIWKTEKQVKAKAQESQITLCGSFRLCI